MNAIVPDDGDASGWPNTNGMKPRTNGRSSISSRSFPPKELSTHVNFDYVAVLEEAGVEARCYISAYAVAVNANSEISTIRLDDIYEKAWQMGKIATEAAIEIADQNHGNNPTNQ